MTESGTPICDLIERLLASHVVPGTLGSALDVARPVEVAMKQAATIAGRSDADRREKQRKRKADWRARAAALSPGHEAATLSLSIPPKTQGGKKKEKTRVPRVPGTTGDDDGWPDDHLDQFWSAFPPFRRQSKRLVGEKLARLRRDGIVTWPVLIEGVRRYAATNPGQYAQAPIPWLNGDKWDRVYGPQQQGGTGDGPRADDRPRSAADTIIAAARRRAGAGGGDG